MVRALCSTTEPAGSPVQQTGLEQELKQATAISAHCVFSEDRKHEKEWGLALQGGI